MVTSECQLGNNFRIVSIPPSRQREEGISITRQMNGCILPLGGCRDRSKKPTPLDRKVDKTKFYSDFFPKKPSDPGLAFFVAAAAPFHFSFLMMAVRPFRAHIRRPLPEVFYATRVLSLYENIELLRSSSFCKFANRS